MRESLYKLVNDENGEIGVCGQHHQEDGMLEKHHGECFGGAEDEGEDLILQKINHHRMIQENGIGQLAEALEDFPVQQLVDPGFWIIHGQHQKYKGNQVNVVVALGCVNREECKNRSQVEQQLLGTDVLVIGGGGEVIGKNAHTDGREGSQDGGMEEQNGAPAVFADIQISLNHQNGGGQDKFPGQFFILMQDSVNKVAADEQGAQLPEGVIGAAVEKACILQEEVFGNGGIHIFHDHHDLVGARLFYKGNDTGNEGVYGQDDQRKDVVGIKGLDMILGVTDLVVVVVRVGLILVIKLFSQEEAGNDEKQLYGDAGAGRKLRAEMEYGDQIGKSHLQNIKRINALHGYPLANRLDFDLIIGFSGGNVNSLGCVGGGRAGFPSFMTGEPDHYGQRFLAAEQLYISKA